MPLSCLACSCSHFSCSNLSLSSSNFRRLSLSANSLIFASCRVEVNISKFPATLRLLPKQISRRHGQMTGEELNMQGPPKWILMLVGGSLSPLDTLFSGTACSSDDPLLVPATSLSLSLFPLPTSCSLSIFGMTAKVNRSTSLPPPLT